MSSKVKKVSGKYFEDQRGSSTELKNQESGSDKGSLPMLLTISGPVITFLGLAIKVLLDASMKVSYEVATWSSSLVLVVAIAFSFIAAVLGYQKKDNVAMTVGVITSIVAIVIILYNALL